MLKQELLAQASERIGAQHYGAERQESGEAKAERLVQEKLKRLHWREEELGRRRKRDPAKGHRPAAAAGDDHDAGVDRAPAEHGRVDACVEPAAGGKIIR